MPYQFRDSIHGMISVSDEEEKIISHPAFQRLRYIRQLGTSYLVYHGAEHTRFGHSLGVMHLVGKAMDSLRRRHCLDDLSEKEFQRLKQIGRIVALLHDIGHGPFSHVGEDSGLYPKLKDIDGEEKSGHEVYTRLIVRDCLGDLIDELFREQGITKEDILSFLLGWIEDKRYCFVKDLISGQLDADRMDYLLRDSHYCGVQYGKYDLHRLLDTLCICYPNNDPSREWQLGVESDGVHAVEEFIFARYWMFIQVYFHKTRRIYDYYLTNFVKFALRLHNHDTYPANITDYLSWNDAKVIQLIELHGKANNDIWASNLYNRRHIKEAFVSVPHPEDDEDEKKDELGRIAWVMEEVQKKFPINSQRERFYIDQSKTSSSKYLIDIPRYIKETQDDEDNKLFAIPVRDKLTKKIKPIQDYSLPVKNISDRKINILRVYAHGDIVQEVKDFCNYMFEIGYDEYLTDLEKTKKEYEELQAKLAKAADFKKNSKAKYM